jgi:hypothetical protein
MQCPWVLVQRGDDRVGRWWCGPVERLPSLFADWSAPGMPNKSNDARRHHIPKMTFKVTNWAAYEAGLRRRGSLTLWVSEEAIAAWCAAPRMTPGGHGRHPTAHHGGSEWLCRDGPNPAGPPHSAHRRHWSPGLATADRLWEAEQSGIRDGALQAHPRRPSSCPHAPRPASRSRHRRHHPESHDRSSTPELRPRRLIEGRVGLRCVRTHLAAPTPNDGTFYMGRAAFRFAENSAQGAGRHR